MRKHTRQFSLAIAVAIAATAGCGGTERPATMPPATPPATKGETPSALASAAPAEAAPSPKPPALRLGDAVKPLSYQAHLFVDPNADSFRGQIAIHIELTRAANHMWLNGRDLTIQSASLERNGSRLALKTLPGGRDFIGFAFPTELGAGRATLTIRYRGRVSATNEAGLFRQKQGGNWYLYSQFEAIDARRAFPCFDEPSFKVPWQLKLTVENDLVAVSNTPVVSKSVDAKTGDKTVTFAKTKPLPSYLIALAVGPFDVVRGGAVGRNKAPFRVIVPHGRAAAASYAVKATPAFVKLLEDYFDVAYPFPKLDLIAIPHFLGAMENPGAITCAEGILTRDHAHISDQFRRVFAHVVAHELAHQWFGDLVTLAWWNDTWLNESFADWLSLKLIYRQHPEWNGAIRTVQGENYAKAADRLASAHAIREPITSDDDIANVFSSGIAYAKGRSVLGMFERWIGEKTFQKGVRAYIHAHAWKTATAPDFLAALAAASRPQVAEALKTFIEQPGTPLVSVKLSCDKGASPALSLAQRRSLPIGSKASADETWSVPVCVAYPDGHTTARQCQLLTAKTGTMKLTHVKRCPRWVLANDGGIGYYRVAYPPALLRKLLRARKLTTAEELDVFSDLRAQISAGKLSAVDGLSALPSLLRRRDPYLTRGAASLVADLDAHLVPQALRNHYARYVRKLFGRTARRLGWKARRRDSDAVRALRQAVVPLVAGAGHDTRLARRATALAHRWLKTRSGIDPDLTDAVLRTAARHGGAKLYDAYYKAAKAEANSRYRRLLLRAMASFRDPALLKRNLHIFLSNQFERHDATSLLMIPGDWSQGHDMLWSFLKQHFEKVRHRMPSTLFGNRLIRRFASDFCDAQHRAGIQAFFNKARIAELRGAPRTLAQTLETTQLCIASRNAQAHSVASFLRKQ